MESEVENLDLDKINQLAQDSKFLLDGEEVNLDSGLIFQTDEECRTCILKMKQELNNLKPKEIRLLDKCIRVTKTAIDGSIKFNPVEYINLFQLMERYPQKAKEIEACIEYINSSTSCIADFPPDFYLTLAETYGALMPSTNKSKDSKS